ncbi:MAG: hypothetical protein IKH57_09825 [Clostridia bacterium]|nr:hypothetical protein [Clostridia bacterium]
MPKWERRYIVHDKIFQMMAREATERRHAIPDDDPDADEKRNAIEQQFSQDVMEFSRFYFGKKKGAECWLCCYREWAEQARLRQIERRWMDNERE